MLSILMATYNGEKYIADQIDSLLSQSFNQFKLYISDDFSQDNTWEILKLYANRYADRIFISRREFNSGNAKHNFLKMMVEIKDDYIMLCDQDDVWMPDKIQKSLTKIINLEQNYGVITPLLVHTDLFIVDENLNVVNSSFKSAMNANYDKTSLNQQLIQNTLTGCTAIYNRALAKLIKVQPDYCVMHDWWLMLIASAFGKIDHIDDATVLYRQHGKNVIGAKDVRKISYKINKLLNGQEVKKAINDTYKQTESFLEIYSDKLTDKQKKLLETYVKVPTMNKWNRWRTVCKLGILKNGISRKIANFIFI